VSRKRIIVFLFLSLVVFFYVWSTPHLQSSGTIKVWDRNNTLLYESAGQIGSQLPVTYGQIPRHLIDAVVTAEDRSFWHHSGIDPLAMVRSAYINLRAGKIKSGASTVTQQLARLAFMPPSSVSRKNWFRKIREILVALRLELRYSKKDLLAMYLNRMYFGNTAYGVQAAANTYFDRDVSQLSLAQSAFLAGLLSSPDIVSARSRVDSILDRMAADHLISPDSLSATLQEPLSLAVAGSSIKAPHFVHFVLEEARQLPGLDTDQGVNIYTTLDYPTYILSQEIAFSWVARLQSDHDLSNAALVLIRNDTGEILSMLGGINYFDATNSGQVNMTVALRQPGSALKPITYAAAFTAGYTPATLIYDVKKVYPTQTGEGFAPNNYDGRYHGLVLARTALASSLNLPAVEILSRIGIPKLLSTAQKMGITTFTQTDRYDLALTLGGGEIRLLELANAYATFARGGNFLPVKVISKIISDSGQILFDPSFAPAVPVLGDWGQQVSYLVTDILSDSKARIPGFGEKNPLSLSRPAAVKTGTTTDWHDNWTIGYTPDYTVGVWVGNNDNHPMTKISGVVGAAPIWNQFFEEFLKSSPPKVFSRPAGLVDVEICALSGLLPDGLCPDLITEKFIAGTQPLEISRLHRKINIDTHNQLLASDICPAKYVTQKIFINYPPEVYSWAKENNQPIIPNEFSPLCMASVSAPSAAFLAITHPVDQAVFQTAPLVVNREKISFEANVSADIRSVSWFVDDQLIADVKAFPFTAFWSPVAGSHQITASAFTSGPSSPTVSKQITIKVIEFKN